MTRLDELAPHTPIPARQRARRRAHDPVRQARARRSDDAILASYVRELAASSDYRERSAARPCS